VTVIAPEPPAATTLEEPASCGWHFAAAVGPVVMETADADSHPRTITTATIAVNKSTGPRERMCMTLAIA
jgi:hypothetical protein